ncbi:MAG: segregation/condensation protein A [Bauldia sp.]|nr:segregation/condensation protein A [Bauldia sp.]
MSASIVNTVQPELWEEDRRPPPAETLVVDVAGFEGPLDLLLDLARTQKVDLSRVSVLALAEQYLAFIETTRVLKLELAGDYLVMAAWLAYLKSRLLLPEPPADEEPTGEEMAAALALRLRRLEAMREAASRLMRRDRLGRDVFARGEPEIRIEKRSTYSATLYDLLTAYAMQAKRKAVPVIQMGRRPVWSLADARAILTRMIGKVAEWTPLRVFLSPYLKTEAQRTALASSFWASLELARQGSVELRQSAPFAPLLMRSPPEAVKEVSHG